ncbi:MAG: MFS transporter [Clostridia bacterium]|nr:MFS transporter [Clostridia bacterium]
MKINYTRLKWAAYTANVSMSVVACLSPLLFVTFRTLYGISYTQLGLLVLINFVTQLTVDLLLSFFPHKFNIEKTVRLIPVLVTIGLGVYAIFPFVFPDHVYIGLVLGTIIFSASSGFNEVLANPVILSVPSDDPDRELSKLHSTYAWGIVGVIIVGTLFLLAFGSENWQYLALLFMLVPISSIVLFTSTGMPQIATLEKVSGAVAFLKNKMLWLCVIAIFFGGAAEVTMTQWCSAYLEQSLGIPKVWGDLLGMSLFAVALGLGRSLYAARGKNIGRVLVLGSVGAFLCYVIAAFTDIAAIGLLACAFTGFCVSMLWPGSILVSSESFKSGGVFIFAMMASGGDFGAAIGPQLLGVVTDAAIANPALSSFASQLSLSVEQLAMKIGILSGAVFPLLAIPFMWAITRKPKTNIGVF